MILLVFFYSAAFNPERARNQNITVRRPFQARVHCAYILMLSQVGVSFGETRELKNRQERRRGQSPRIHEIHI